jgi:hypothetical protein
MPSREQPQSESLDSRRNRNKFNRGADARLYPLDPSFTSKPKFKWRGAAPWFTYAWHDDICLDFVHPPEFQQDS